MLKKFSFIFPITEPVTDKGRREGLSYIHTGDWRINGEAYKIACSSPNSEDIFEFKIDEILYEGTDINPVLTTTEMVEAVKAACFNHIQNIFNNEHENDQLPQHKIGIPLGKIIYMPLVLHRKVK
ncbi:MAG: hypothetical protein ABI402_10005 [Ferruginibacter sp.]